MSLAVRVLYFIQIRGNPFFETPIMDEGYHDLWAREIASGDWTARIPFFRAPLYPFLLGAAYRVFGPDLGLIRLLQLVAGAVTPALTYAVGRRLVPEFRWVATASAFVVALDGLLFYFEGDLLLESLLAPLATLFTLVLLRAGETGRPARWLVTGMVLGLFAITRPNILLFAPVALALALGWKGADFTWRRPRIRPAVALTLGTCALVLPVTAANWFLGGDRVLISSQAGLNFFLGNNAEANGWSATAPSVFRIDWWGGYEDAIALAEEAEGRTLSASEVSAHWFGRAFEWWRLHPVDGLAITVRKIVLFFSGIEFGNNRDIRLFFLEFAPIGLPSLALLYFVMPCSVVGMITVWRRGSIPGRALVLLVAVYIISVVLFFVTARYRVPLRPLLCVFAWEGGRVAWANLEARGLRGAAPLATALGIGLVANWNPWIAGYRPSAAQFYQSVANVYHEKGQLLEALDRQRRALEIDPTYPKGNLNLGTLYMMLGNADAAVEAFERERVLDPQDGENLASLARAYDRTGRLDEAERTYALAEDAGLVDARALYNHAFCLERLKRPQEAEELYRRSVEADTTFAEGWNNLGVMRARAGRLDEAVPMWEKVLEIQPGHPRATDNLNRARAMEQGGG